MQAPVAVFSSELTPGARLLACWLWACVPQLVDRASVQLLVSKPSIRARLRVSRGTLDRHIRELYLSGWAVVTPDPHAVGASVSTVPIRLFVEPAVPSPYADQSGEGGSGSAFPGLAGLAGLVDADGKTPDRE